MSGRIGYYGGIVQNGLLMNLDASKEESYNGIGNVWFDISGNGKNGTLNNDPILNSEGNGCIVFDGIDDFVNLGNVGNTINGTISIWFRLTNTINSNINYRLWGKNVDWEARWNSNNGGLAWDPGTSDVANTTFTSQTIWLNSVWYNVVFSWSSDLNTCSMYIQGNVNVTTSDIVNPSGLSGDFLLGRSVSGGNIPIRIGHFTIYNRQLNTTEIQQNYNALKGRYGI